MIVREGSYWVLYTADGKRVLGRHKTKKSAEKQEKMVQMMKKRRGHEK